jgi:hypothetical protein|tara:strand:- start:573 stop:1262 length:690 start_codon:yes stop_codon:yes gene_type:complete
MTTYSELVTQIRDYCETDSNVLTTTIVNDIIEHAELKIFREIDLDVFKKYKTASLTSSDAFVAMPGALPVDFEFARYVHIFSPSGSLGGLTDNERVTLQKKDSSYINEYWPNRTSTGVPKYYANWDNDTIILAPTPNAAYTIELAYNAQPTGLSSSNTTTWVSNNAPQLLLYACLIEAFKFLKNPDMLNIYTVSYKEELQTMGQEQMGRRRRDEYMDGIVRVPMPSQNP